MYNTIYVPLDNSDFSNAASDLAVSLGKALEAKLVGGHAYAAKLHDVRFKQMEFTLPDEYKEETELEKQRRIHDALITRGLQLISDSYLVQTEKRAKEAGVEFEPRHYDGKNFEVIVDDIAQCAPDLLVMGALGQGAVRDSTVGSVCERVLRRCKVDTLVVRDVEQRTTTAPGGICVAMDGSRHAYGALQGALELARQSGKPVELTAVLPESSTESALLRRHLEVASGIARGAGVDCSIKELEGNAFDALRAHVEQAKPWLVAVGRTGIDGSDGEIGSVAERLVRLAACNVLVAARSHLPADSMAAAE